MVVDSQKKPMLVTVEHGKTITLPEDPDQKDVDFYQLIADSCGNDTYGGNLPGGRRFFQKTGQ